MQLGEFCRSVQSHKDLGWVTSIVQDELQFLETGFHSVTTIAPSGIVALRVLSSPNSHPNSNCLRVRPTVTSAKINYAEINTGTESKL